MDRVTTRNTTPATKPKPGPLHAAHGVGVQGGLAHLAGELGIVRVELLRDLVEDALLRPRKAARWLPLSRWVVRSSFHRPSRSTTRSCRWVPHCWSPRFLTLDPVGSGQRRRHDRIVPVAGPDGVDGPGGVVPGRRLHVVEAELAGGALGQLADVDPEQPHARGGIDLLEQLGGGPRTSGPVSTADGSVTERVMVRKSWKRTLMVTVRPAIPPTAAVRHRVAESDELPLERLEAVVVVGEGLLVADRLGPSGAGSRRDRRSPWPAAGGAIRWRRRARRQRPLVEGGQVGDGVDAEPVELLEGLRSDAPERLDRERVEEGEHLVRGHDLDPRPGSGPRGRCAAWPPRRPAWPRTSTVPRRPSR